MDGYLTDRALERDMESNPTRQHPRFTAHSVIRLHWTDWGEERPDTQRSFGGVCTDVAIGGIGAYTVSEFAIGDVLGVEFVDTPLPILQAQVVYRNGFDYGLKFLDIV